VLFRSPVGTKFRFTVSEPARVRFAFTQRVRRHKRRRVVTRGALSFNAAAGAHSVTFQGRLSRHKRIKPGRYTLVITATNAAGQRSTARLTFVVVRG